MKTGIFTPPAVMTNIDALRQAAEAGYSAFEPFAAYELAMPDVSVAAAIRAEADRLGIVLPTLSVGIDVTADGAVEKLKGYARCAREMGMKYLHHTIYPSLDPKAAALEFEPMLEKAVKAAREVFDYAADIGVTCIYENQGFIFNGLERYDAFIDCLDRPAGVVLDMGNIAFVGEEADAFAAKYASRIVHCHVKDYKKCAQPADNDFRLCDGSGLRLANIGEGDMKIAESAAILRNAGYEGWFMLECSPISDGYAEQKINMDRLMKL